LPLIDRRAVPVKLTEHGEALVAVAADVVRQHRHKRLSFVETKRTERRCFLTVLSGHQPRCHSALVDGILNHMAPCHGLLLTPGDGPIAQWRRWCDQFQGE
jgi:hypothetical protein